MGLPSSSVVKNPLAMQEILGLERSPGVGKCNTLQYSCLENSMDTGAWWATSMGCQEWDTRTQLSNLAHMHCAVIQTWRYSWICLHFLINSKFLGNEESCAPEQSRCSIKAFHIKCKTSSEKKYNFSPCQRSFLAPASQPGAGEHVRVSRPGPWD